MDLLRSTTPLPHLARLARLAPLSAALFIACNPASPPTDTTVDAGPRGRPASDGGAPRVDASPSASDTAAPPATDGSVPNADAGPSANDAAPAPATDAGMVVAPANFWDSSGIPPAKNVMMFKFLNRTNGKFADSEVYWSFKTGAINETHSIAEAPLYDMPANSSGRLYFYLCSAATGCTGDPTKSKYFDFIEHTIGTNQYNGNTTRVDAFGIKVAMRLHCADGFDVAVGEDYETFAEDRAVTFQKFINEVTPEFAPLAQPPFAPFRIVEPGAVGFGKGGAHAAYYDDFINQIWAINGITIPKPGPNGDGLGAYPDLSAAIFRHVGNKAGTFTPDGKLLDRKLWTDAKTFYSAAPADYYAKFWHQHGLGGKAYGFPYDDVGGYSSFVSHSQPQYILVAIGW